MSKLLQAIRDRRAQRTEYRNSIHYAISHAVSRQERNELITFATEQGVLV